MHNSNHNINSNKDIKNNRDGNRTTFGGHLNVICIIRMY